MSLFDKTGKALENVAKTTVTTKDKISGKMYFQRIGDKMVEVNRYGEPLDPNFSAPKVEKVQEAPLAKKEWMYSDPYRGEINITQEDLDAVRPVLFGEIGNRDLTKKELEARVIVNTVLNRAGEFKRLGTPKALREIVEDKNIYQAYGSDQYNLYKTPDKMNELDKKKKEEVDMIIDKIYGEIQSNSFKDNTNQAFNYIHNEDGTISFDEKARLWADRDLRKRD